MEVKILSSFGLSIAAQFCGLPIGRAHKSAWLHASHRGVIHRNDVEILQRLILAGDDHAKIMRMAQVWLLVRGPRYWWQQFATYRIGMEMYSESTMHTLLRDGVTDKDFTPETSPEAIDLVASLIEAKRPLAEVKAALPEGFLQTRLVQVNYQTLRRMWGQRKNHKLQEWQDFFESIRSLPYADQLIFCE